LRIPDPTPFDQAPSWRVISTRHRSIDLFEGVADAAEWEALLELEGRFSPGAQEIMLLDAGLPRDAWAFGPGAGYVMAPFLYRGPSRFSTGAFGVYYAGLEEETAIREVAFHRGRFLAATREPPCVQEMRVLRATVTGSLVDLRPGTEAFAPLLQPDPATYPAGQAFAADLRDAGEDGLVYPSVRHPGGACVACFKPRLISACRQTRPLTYVWDGQAIAGWSKG